MGTMRILTAVLTLLAVCATISAQSRSAGEGLTEPSAHLSDFQAIEFRRYTIKQGESKHFAEYFESYFPEAIEQTGAIVAGSFFERKNQNGFTWIRGFRTIEARAIESGEFYYGPVWREHRTTMNNLIADSDNVLLLRPLTPDRGVTILPPVDPVMESDGSRGVVVALIFPVRENRMEAFAKQAEATFSSYRAAGAREAGVLVTLDENNNFPQLPIRTDGPYLVWLGALKDNETLEKQFTPLAESSMQSLSATGLIRGTPEFVVLEPTPRSRLRWFAQ
jgi:hypothetical protein